MKNHLYFIFYLFLLPFSSNATVFQAIASSDWNSSSTWDKNQIPGTMDTVIIDGYEVWLSSGINNIQRLEVTNISDVGKSYFYIDGSAQLTITGDLVATSENVVQDVVIEVLSTSNLRILGDAIFIRKANNKKTLNLNVGNFSNFTVDGDFTFDYQNSHPSENGDEINLANSATFTVGGLMDLTLSGGNNFEFYLSSQSTLLVDSNLIVNVIGGDNFVLDIIGGSNLTINGDLVLNNSGGLSNMVSLANSSGASNINGDIIINSTVSNKLVELEVSGSSSPNFLGDINMSAVGDGDILIDLRGESTTNLKGNITRTGSGSLNMGDNSTLNFNGNTQQSIPSETQTGTNDLFNFSNILINNTSGLPMLMEGPITITTDLNLQSGSIQTTSTNIITLADTASITGASQTSFIDGPLIKKGRTNNLSFTFPTGKNGIYAPITISKVTNAASEYKAEYFGDPPPWGNNLEASINNINGNNYWELSKTSGSDNVDIGIHWSGDIANGITDTDDLIVARLSETSGSEIWENYGNNAITGNTTEGTVTSSLLMGDPPPWGNEKFTLGSISALNSLPVELTKFQAAPQGTHVYMQWETATERNTSHFEIERSKDVINFETLGSISSVGNTNSTQIYNNRDLNPQNGLNYYRLKIVDNDGSFEYSHIEVVKFESSPSIELFPNPVKDVIQLKIDDSNSKENTIEVFDRNGRRLFIGNFEFENGRLKINVNEINLIGNGTYLLRISGKTENQILKFIKME